MDKIIRDYAHKELKQITTSPDIAAKVIRNSNSKNVLNRTDFPGSEGVFVMPHVMLANYSPVKANLHCHDFFEIIYVYRGSAIQYTQNTYQKLEEGSIFIMNTNFYHGIHIDSNDDIIFNILIEPRIFNLSLLSLLSENSVLSNFFAKSLFLEDQIGEYIYFPYDSQSNATGMLDSLLLEWIKKQNCYQSSIISYLTLAFTELVRQQMAYISSNNHEQNAELENMIIYMNSNIQNVSLKTMADQFHYSPEYLSKLFKKYFGKTFSIFLSDMKLEKAADYLKKGDHSIDSIASSLGYYDRSYFNRSFKKKYGVSPSQYMITE